MILSDALPYGILAGLDISEVFKYHSDAQKGVLNISQSPGRNWLIFPN